MLSVKSLVLSLILSILVFVPNRVAAYSSPGTPTGYVNDFAGVLTPEIKQQLETRLSTLDASTSAQISVVTIKNLGGDSIENYTEKLFAEWGIGQKGKDNGVLLLVAVDDREMRIEVGYGLEGALTDAESSWIIRDQITPRFKEGNYNQGIVDGVEGIIKAAAEDLNPVFSKEFNMNIEESAGLALGILTWAVPVVLWLISILSRSKSWWAGGVIGGLIGVLTMGIGGMILWGLVGLFIDYAVSTEYKKSKVSGNYPWWIGGKSGFGGGGGFRSGGGGFGGFGGGRSGGGGSSGRW